MKKILTFFFLVLVICMTSACSTDDVAKKEAEGLIKILVKKIVLYDDKIQIHYNYIDKKNTLEDNQECSFYKDSFEKEIENTKISGENYDFALDIEAYI